MSAQDADMYPTASGDALGTVKQHQRPENLVFWAGWVRMILFLIKLS